MMQKRKIDELISRFNCKVSNMDIDRKYKMELFGMITAIGIACEKELNVEPERKTGKWEIYVISPFDGEGCRCSECKYEGAPYWNFCPNCGADMRGEGDEETL